MQVDDAVVEGGGAGGQVELPHTDETFVEGFAHLVQVFPEVVQPAQQGAGVVEAEVFHVQDVELVLGGKGDHLPQAGDDAAGEDVFFHPGVAGMLQQAADEVEQEEAAGLHDLVHAIQKKLIVVPAHVLHHAHADHPLEFPAGLGQVPVVHKLYGQQVLKALGLDAPLELLVLLLTQGDAGAADAVLLGGPDEQEAPAAADVQQGHPLLEVELFQNVVHLVHLGLVEGVVLPAEIAAGIAEGFIQPQLVKIVADVVVALDLLLLVFLGGGGENELFQGALVLGELPHLPHEVVQGIVQVPLDLQGAVHIGLPQGQGRAGHQVGQGKLLVQDDRKGGFPLPDEIFLSLELDAEGVLVEFFQKGQKGLFL